MPDQELRGWFENGQGDEDLLSLAEYLTYKKGNDLEKGWAILDIYQLPEPAQTYFKNQDAQLRLTLERMRVHDEIKEPVRLVWSSGPMFNAMAIKHGGKYFIILKEIIPRILGTLFMKLMSSPTFLLDIGDVSLEKEQPKIQFQQNILGVLINPTSNRPNCPTRDVFAYLLFEAALDFLLFHELCHIGHGHLELGRREFLVEIDADVRDRSEALESHTLEMDADSGAVIRAFNYLEQINTNKDIHFKNEVLGRYLEILGKFKSSHHAHAKILFISMLGVFSFFPSQKFSVENMYEGDHPNPIPRLNMAAAILPSHVRRFDPVLEADMPHILADTWQEYYQEIVPSKEFQQISSEALDILNGATFATYKASLHKCWDEKLYDILNPRKLTKWKLAPKYENAKVRDDA